MTIESHNSVQAAASLIRQADNGASAAHIAESIIATWQQIDATLAPIIGRGGVAALYKRSLSLTAPAYPWLAGTYDGVQTSIDLAPLRSVLMHQSSASVAAAGGALLQTFNQLLASLVGTSLTERLLRPVWANAFSAPPAQDSTS